MNPNTATAADRGNVLLGGDMPVNRLGSGAVRLVLGGSVHDPQAAVAMLRRAVELGVNHIDTAGFYGARQPPRPRADPAGAVAIPGGPTDRHQSGEPAPPRP